MSSEQPISSCDLTGLEKLVHVLAVSCTGTTTLVSAHCTTALHCTPALHCTTAWTHKIITGKLTRSSQANSQDHHRQTHKIITGRLTRSLQADSQDHHRQTHKIITGRLTRSLQAPCPQAHSSLTSVPLLPPSQSHSSRPVTILTQCQSPCHNINSLSALSQYYLLSG